MNEIPALQLRFFFYAITHKVAMSSGAVVVPRRHGTAPAGKTKKVTKSTAAYYALNVLLNTVLFIMIFMTATAWASAAQDAIKHSPHVRGALTFAGAATAVTFVLAIGFGLLSDAVPQIDVDYVSLLDQATPGGE
jgi:hypothetical protein